MGGNEEKMSEERRAEASAMTWSNTGMPCFGSAVHWHIPGCAVCLAELFIRYDLLPC